MSDAMTFNEAVIDLKQYIARCAGGHQVYIQAKIDALVAAHEREMLAARAEKKEANND